MNIFNGLFKGVRLAFSLLVNVAVSIIATLSLVFSFFRLYPKLIIPKLTQILFPFSFFGRFVWWIYYRIFSVFRKYHVDVVATTGAGKSFLLLQLIYRDILRGVGFVVIEPHSQLIRHVLHLKALQLNHKPQHYKRILLLDFEDKNPPALNLFAIELPKDKDNRQICINALVQQYLSAMEKYFEIPFGVRRVLKNILTVLFDFPNATLEDGLNMLDPKERLLPKYVEFFTNLENPVLKKYFNGDFFGVLVEPSKNALRLRLEQLLLDPVLNKSFSQPNNILNLEQIFFEGRIVLVKAGQKIGTETSNFLGALIHQYVLYAGFRRINRRRKKRFSIYLDECQNYISHNYDICRGLEEARKAKLEYVLCHQRTRQRGMTRDQQRALNGCGIKIFGRLEYEDAFRLCKQLLMRYQENRFVNLRPGEFMVKCMWLKTRFIKIPRYFAPIAEKIGVMDHKLFCKDKDFRALIRYLKGQISSKKVQSTTKTSSLNTSFNFTLNDV